MNEQQKERVNSFVNFLARRTDSLNANVKKVTIAHHGGGMVEFMVPNSSQGMFYSCTVSGEKKTLNRYHPKAYEAIENFVLSNNRSVLSIIAFSEERNCGVAMAICCDGENYQAVRPEDEQWDQFKKNRIFPVDFVLENN